MTKEQAVIIIGWIENTLLHPDKISEYFSLKGKEKRAVRVLAKRIREKNYPGLYGKRSVCQSL